MYWRAVSELEVGQLCPVGREITPCGIAANLDVGQQENLRTQAVRPAIDVHAGATSGAVRDFRLSDLGPDVGVDQVEERAVQVAVDGAVGIVIDVGAVPLSALIQILHQQPCAVAGLVVDGRRLSLLDNNEVPQSAVDFNLDDTAYGLAAEGN